jgi:hypothetical protein
VGLGCTFLEKCHSAFLSLAVTHSKSLACALIYFSCLLEIYLYLYRLHYYACRPYMSSRCCLLTECTHPCSYAGACIGTFSTTCISISQHSCLQMATAGSHRGREDLLRAELTEHGRFSELLNMQVPFAIDPEVTLVSVVPEVCSSQ